MMNKVYAWLDERLGISRTVLPVSEHPIPRSCNWFYVLGSATMVAFIVQVVTGVALAFSYVPAPNSAYQSLIFITDDATLGSVVRGIHYWGASAMVILISLHMTRTFLFGSYKYPREVNWLTGVILLFTTLGLAFTGQLLRWDQDAYWAVYVAAEQAGRVPLIGHWILQLILAGDTVGGNTLTRFYATHVFLLPAVGFIFIAIHLYLVVKNGISEPPEVGEPVDPATYREKYEKLLHEDGVPFWPDAAWRDVVFALFVGSIVLILAIVFGPKELGAVADPTILKTAPRPDWYFLWLFALLALMPPSVEDYLIVGGPILTVILLIAIPFARNKGERSFRRRPWAVAAFLIVAIAIPVLIYVGDKAPWSPNLTPGELPQRVQAQAQAAGLQKGMDTFTTAGCLNCHSIDGAGGNKGPNLTDVGIRLNRQQLTWRILYGGGGMPEYGQTLTATQAEDLVNFLLQQKTAP
jgi:ubiquinol-cytochrome c reductase cytochrome b subunit